VNLYDEIAQMAYELFEKSGKVEGRDLSNWLEAERIVMARHRGEEKQEAESFSSPKKKTAPTTKQRIKKTETKKRRTKK
jgi:hypothetical protein